MSGILTHPHIGFCIFCGGEGETDDHIVPMALGGTHVLKKSSCEKCRSDLNKRIDSVALNTILLVPRMQLERPRSKKRPPRTKFTSYQFAGDPKVGTQVNMNSEPMSPLDAPDLFVIPVTPTPRILTGLPWDGKTITIERIAVYNGGKHLASGRGGGFHLFSTEQMAIYLTMIAKIGHAAAYLFYDPHGLTPILRELLSGKDDDVAAYVGAAAREDKKSTNLYELSMREEGRFVIATVQLFADKGLPNYDVVVGLRRGWGIFR